MRSLVSRFRQVTPVEAATAILLVASLLLLVVRMAMAWKSHHPFSVDEGYFGAFALGLDHGHVLPHVDAVSQRGPVLYWLIYASQRIGGLYRWAGIHWLAVGCTFATAAATFAVARSVHRPFAGAVAVLVTLILTTTFIALADGIALTGESVGVAFTLIGLDFAFPKGRTGKAADRRILAAALFGALATLSKQTTLVVVPVLAWTALITSERPWRAGLLFALGTVAPFAAVALLYGSQGALSDLIYWTLTYNATIYVAPWKGMPITELFERFLFTSEASHWVASMRFMLALALAVMLARAFPTLVPRRAKDAAPRSDAAVLQAAVALLALATVLSALVNPRQWPHYFILCVPFFALGFALHFEDARDSSQKGTRLALAFLLSGLALVGVGRRLKEVTNPNWGKSNHGGAICKAVADSSSATDSIFVWGFDGDLYVDCHRRPASRYVFTSMLAGVVPGEWRSQRNEWVAPGTRAILKAELEREKPAVLLDIVDTLGGAKLTKVPELAPVLANYCDAGTVQNGGRKARVLRRRTPSDGTDKQCAKRR